MLSAHLSLFICLSAVSLIFQRCLSPSRFHADPEKRATCEEMQCHPWITSQLPADYPRRNDAYRVEVSEHDISLALTVADDIRLSLSTVMTTRMRLKQRLLKARESLEEDAIRSALPTATSANQDRGSISQSNDQRHPEPVLVSQVDSRGKRMCCSLM